MKEEKDQKDLICAVCKKSFKISVYLALADFLITNEKPTCSNKCRKKLKRK